MNEYTVDQLARAETYQSDPELREFAYSLAGSQKQLFPGCTHAQIVEMFLSGSQAERVCKSWQKQLDKWMSKNLQFAAELNEAEKIVYDLHLPTGVTVDLSDDGKILVTIPRDGGLMTPKIKRLGGDWDNIHKRFWLPLSAAKSLPTILKNWKKEYDQKSAEIAGAKRAEAARREQQQREREARWAAERAEEQKRREAQQAQASRARANRERVRVGQYKIGDILGGREIKSFGQSWQATEYHVPTWQGSLYEPCDYCHSDGPVDVGTFRCERCHPDRQKTTVNYCYAYFV